MSYRILTKNGIENTNIDGARDHNFNSGRRSGIVQGALHQGNFFASSENTIALDTCELRLCGHRVVIDSAEYLTFHNKPSVSIRYSLIAQIIVDNDGGVSFDLHAQTSSTALVQDNLDTTGSGTYELEIGRFTQLTDGTITDVVRTADLITGGAGGGDSEYIRIGTVTTNKISPELDADVDIENTINPDDNKPQTNFTFNLPTPSGTVVSVAGEEKTEINTDTTPTANSENLVTSGGVHDYPAIAFAESERQKSKNLFYINYCLYHKSSNLGETGTAINIVDSNLRITLDSNNLIKVKPNTQYTLSTNNSSFKYVIGQLTSSKTTLGDSGWQTNSSFTITTTSTTEYLGLNFGKTDDSEISSADYNNFLSSLIMLEKGSIVTVYQSYYGQITHTGDPAVAFAEDEREKSKNLCCLLPSQYEDSNFSAIYDEALQTITLNGSASGIDVFAGIRNILPNIKNTINKNYTISIIKISGDNSSSFNMCLGSKDVDIWTDRFPIWVAGDGTSSSATITLSTNHTYDTLMLFIPDNSSFSNCVYKVQIEEGSVATEYQPYNGAIVHEKQLTKVTTLWTNPNPSNNFGQQTITLDTDNYDYGIMICAAGNTSLNREISFIFEKGTAPILNYIQTNAGDAYSSEFFYRQVIYTNNKTLNIQDCYYSLKGSTGTLTNNLLIPVKVVGIKLGE